jgi:putative alpha-1,2-mannosidase
VSATLNLENGNKFRIETKNQSVNNVYVKRVILNGTELDFPNITHYDIMQGGLLVFEMSSKPN